MEDDDEFGDLYTDVLQAFPSSTSASDYPKPPPSPHRPIDLNLQIDDQDDSFEAPRNSSFTPQSTVALPPIVTETDNSEDQDRDLADVDANLKSRVLEDEEVKLRHGSSIDLNLGHVNLDFDDESQKDVKFDVEEDLDGAGDELIIPGLSNNGFGQLNAANSLVKEEDDWDSDSEDDLQIVLNDDNHGPMVMDGGGVMGVDDDDEDGDPLLIVADGNDPNQQAMEEQAWGDDGTQGADGERKEIGDGIKGSIAVPKIGYSSHGYHPFHSQFKYVRPGTAPPVAGASAMGPGGAPGQVRPLSSMGPPIGGRGRGEWRPPGIKNGPMQKGFHPAFGMPSWGNGALGRGGGLDFTLPSHKTIFEVEIDSFEEKPWKYPNVDVTDFFNFGLNEESWKDYCKQLEQLRLESTMQSKIRVYESGRTEQHYDPDMPPELAAATCINDVSVENENLVKTDVGHSDPTIVSVQVRPPLILQHPPGRPIQVESGYGERLPSIDTRPPRLRDSDAIIEIVPQVSLEDESSKGNGVLESSDNNSPKQHSKEGYSDEGDLAPVDTEYADDLPPSRGQSPVHSSVNDVVPREERRRRGKQRDRSPKMRVKQSSRDNFLDDEKEGSLESIDGKHSPLLSSPTTIRASDETNLEQIADLDNELVLAEGSSEMEASEMSLKTASSPLSKKKQKLSSRAEHHDTQEFNDENFLKSVRNTKNNKVISDRNSTRSGNVKRQLDEDEQSFRKRDRDGRSDMERKRMLVKGREDPYAYRDWDPNSSHHLHMKTEGFDRRKEREYYEEPHGIRIRSEDSRKRDFNHEMGPRNWAKFRDGDQDENLTLRNNGNWRGHHDKDAGSMHKERSDSLRGRYENMDDYHSKRRKVEDDLRRDHVDKEEVLFIGHREISGRRKQEREDFPDQRRRESQPRIRDNFDDNHSIRLKDEIHLHRGKQRDENQRPKPSVEESSSKREREKLWVKGSDKDYPIKGHSEEIKRRDRIDDVGLLHHRGREDVYPRGNQIPNEERRLKHERLSTRSDRPPNVPDTQRVYDKKPKENTRKNRDFEGVDHKRKQEYHTGNRNETVSLKGTTRQENEVQDNSVHRHSSRKHKENASSEDEQQDSKRGRSKLERWTSHTERDFSITKKPSLRVKEIDNDIIGGSSLATKSLEVADNEILSDKKDAQDMEIKDAPIDDRHLDTVAKLKKRSERFKLPMPSEKEVMATKKMENEPMPRAEAEVTPVPDTEIKQERPARKRRWVSSN